VKHLIAYGDASLSLDVPDERVAGTLAPRPCGGVADVPAAVRESLARPVGSPPLEDLARGRRTALVVTVDNTRPSPAPIVEPVLDVLERLGLEVTVINAAGRHRRMTQAELERHFGPRIMGSCRVLQHDPFDEAGMARRGATGRGTPIVVNVEIFRHDLVIGCGFIEPSYLCGWSGGRKLLMPGLAHHEAIDANHYLLTQPGARIGRLHGNPVSDDAAEFAAALPMHFIVYAVLGPNDELVEVVSGHAVTAHERGCDLSADIYRVRPLSAGIVISSAGGAPYDFDLVQAKKAVIPAAEAVERNGVVILAGACPDGLGAEPTFLEWLKTKTPAEVARDVLDRARFNLGAHGANVLARPIVEKNATVVLVTSPGVAEELRGTYVRAVTRIEDAWRLAGLLAGTRSRVLFIEKARRLILDRGRGGP
jgi:nickel-dependent lactate racemase